MSQQLSEHGLAPRERSDLVDGPRAQAKPRKELAKPGE
jgi:hypothetical protein